MLQNFNLTTDLLLRGSGRSCTAYKTIEKDDLLVVYSDEDIESAKKYLLWNNRPIPEIMTYSRYLATNNPLKNIKGKVVFDHFVLEKMYRNAVEEVSRNVLALSQRGKNIDAK